MFHEDASQSIPQNWLQNTGFERNRINSARGLTRQHVLSGSELFRVSYCLSFSKYFCALDFHTAQIHSGSRLLKCHREEKATHELGQLILYRYLKLKFPIPQVISGSNIHLFQLNEISELITPEIISCSKNDPVF